MIGYLQGRVLAKKLVSKHIYEVIVGVNTGENSVVGYEIGLGERSSDGLLLDTIVELWVYHHITEKGQELFGVSTLEERNLLLKLISISGIGPRVALTMLNFFTVTELLSIISEKDAKKLQKVPGLGAKTAASVIVQFSGNTDLSALLSGDQSITTEDKQLSLVKAGLQQLGFTRDTVTQLIQQRQHDVDLAIEQHYSAEEIIKILLRK